MAGQNHPLEQFPALSLTGICRHAFIQRIPGIEVAYDKAEVLKRLDAVHREIRISLGMGDWPLLTTQQVHGSRIAVVDAPIGSDQHLAGYDGLITNQPGISLGIHVADCCAVYVIDPKTRAIALVHSGRKGTELEITARAIDQMVASFGSQAADLVVQLSPCIRPPHYEVEIAPRIIEQCRSRGVTRIHDSGVCTACDLGRYYSYRAEKGRTGRMLALLGLE